MGYEGQGCLFAWDVEARGRVCFGSCRSAGPGWNRTGMPIHPLPSRGSFNSTQSLDHRMSKLNPAALRSEDDPEVVIRRIRHFLLSAELGKDW